MYLSYTNQPLSIHTNKYVYILVCVHMLERSDESNGHIVRWQPYI